MLQKKNKNKNVYYKVGDVISFRVNESTQKMTAEILDFNDNVIVFEGFDVPANKISSLYIDEKTKWWLRYKVEQLSLIAGGGYLLLSFLNDGEIGHDKLIVCGTLVGVGLLAKVIIGNRIKIRGRTKLRIIRL